MTYEERLYSMRGAELIQEAEKIGVKISHKGTVLKESKDKAVAKILAAVKSEEEPEKPTTKIEEEPKKEPEEPKKEVVEETTKKERYSKEFLEKVLSYINSLENAEAGTWPNTKNLIWVKVPALSKKGRAIKPRLIEIRVGKDKYTVVSVENETLKEKVVSTSKYYLPDSYGKFTFENEFYKTVVETFLR